MNVENALTPARRVGLWLIRAQAMLAITFALLVALELFAGRQLKKQESFERPLEYFWSECDSYRDAPWLAEYVREFQASRLEWLSYLYWKRRPMEGRYVNVDSNGVRRTISPAPTNAAGPVRTVWVFGGSTTWGEGARDEHTIPSELERQLREKGVNVRVVNQGEGGYVSTQELIKFLLLLREGGRPDAVVFLDGVNDTYSAWENGRAGIPQNEVNRVTEFNLSGRMVQVVALAAKGGPRGWNTIRWLRSKLHRAGAAGGGAAEDARLDALAADAWRLYEGNLRNARAAGAAVGCRALFYWQPVVYSKPQRTGFEERLRTVSPPGVEAMYLKTYALARRSAEQGPPEGFIFIGNLFEGVKDPRFIDYCHVSETGNAEIAARIAADLLPLLGVASP